jgi:DNA polymerase III delta subunit
VLLLTGQDETRVTSDRRELLAAHPGLEPEAIELAEDGVRALVVALSSPALFGPQRLLDVTGFDAVTAEQARTLAKALEGSQAVLVVRGTKKPHPAVLKTLGAAVTHRHHEPPAARELPRRVRDDAERHGVSLDRAALDLLVARAGHDLTRVEALLSLASRAGLPRLDARQVGVLLGSFGPDLAPWKVTDALGAGRLDDALALARASELQPLLVALGRFVLQVAELSEAGVAEVNRAASTLGLPAWQLRAACSVAGRLDAASAASIVARVTDLTVASRDGVEEPLVWAELDLVLAALTGIAA